MKKIIYTILFLVVMTAGIFFLRKNLDYNKTDVKIVSDVSQEIVLPEPESSKEKEEDNLEKGESNEAVVVQDIFLPPLDRTKERITKKPFGIFITPANSPVQPEKFSGYHTGVDFEIFPQELETAVSISAVCTGKLLVKRIASGYGGVAVQSCDLEGAPITVVYGHLKLDSIKVAQGGDIIAGEALGTLGRAYSPETSGERKHLHLSFHKGSEANILGYVSSMETLSNWLDPVLFLK